MDDHKLVMISIFFGFLKHGKDTSFFLNKNMLGKVFRFWPYA
jgi:hypothetical protein